MLFGSELKRAPGKHTNRYEFYVLSTLMIGKLRGNCKIISRAFEVPLHFARMDFEENVCYHLLRNRTFQHLNIRVKYAVNSSYVKNCNGAF